MIYSEFADYNVRVDQYERARWDCMENQARESARRDMERAATELVREHDDPLTALNTLLVRDSGDDSMTYLWDGYAFPASDMVYAVERAISRDPYRSK